MGLLLFLVQLLSALDKGEMNMSRYLSLVSVFLILSPMFSEPVFASPEKHPLIRSFPQSNLFKFSEKTFDRVELVGGPIEYISKSNEGYLASSLVGVVGQSKTYINDYAKSYSAEHLHQEMMDRFSKEGFEILYSCSGLSCGDVSGWNLYLSEFIQGDEPSQHYALAKQKGNQGNVWYVQYYVIDLDGEPRSILRVLNENSRPELRLSFNSKLISVSNSSVASVAMVPTVLFEFDTAVLAPEALSYISKLKSEIVASGAHSLVISGHTDSKGSTTYNRELSMRRALAVAAELQKSEDLGGVSVSVKSYGETRPIADNSTADGRKSNRRVSIDLSANDDLSMTDINRKN